jgi:hypothetical protein
MYNSKLGKQNVRCCCKKTEEPREKETSRIPDDATISSSHWSSQAATIHIQHKTIVIIDVPTNHTVRVNNKRGMESVLYHFSRILNAKINPSEGPGFFKDLTSIKIKVKLFKAYYVYFRSLL